MAVRTRRCADGWRLIVSAPKAAPVTRTAAANNASRVVTSGVHDAGSRGQAAAPGFDTGVAARTGSTNWDVIRPPSVDSEPTTAGVQFEQSPVIPTFA